MEWQDQVVGYVADCLYIVYVLLAATSFELIGLNLQCK